MSLTVDNGLIVFQLLCGISEVSGNVSVRIKYIRCNFLDANISGMQ